MARLMEASNPRKAADVKAVRTLRFEENIF